MSWDFHLEHPLPKCPSCGHEIPWPDDGFEECSSNYTYNVSQMFYDAFGGEGIRALSGMRGREAATWLKGGIDRMALSPEHYMAMNPKNGWGNYEGALQLLRELREWAERYPEAIFKVS